MKIDEQLDEQAEIARVYELIVEGLKELDYGVSEVLFLHFYLN